MKLQKSDARQKVNEILISWELTHAELAKRSKDAKLDKFVIDARLLRIVKSRTLDHIPVLEVLWEDQGG